jgi:hypothetical protein
MRLSFGWRRKICSITPFQGLVGIVVVSIGVQGFRVRCMEGRSVRSTERSEARNTPTLRSRGTPKLTWYDDFDFIKNI